MESPPQLSCYVAKKSKKRTFSGGSSTCMEEADVVEIPPPVNWSSNSKQRKEKKVFSPEIIHVDEDETCPKLKADTSDKGKTVADYCSAEIHHYAAGNNVKSSESSYAKGSNNLHEAYNDIIYEGDEYMESSANKSYDDRYALLQSHFDELDIPPGIEVYVPWFMDNEGKNLGSASTNSDSQIQLDHVGLPSWKVSSPSSLLLESEHAKGNSSSGSSLNPHIKSDAKKLKLFNVWSSMDYDLPNKPASSRIVQSSSSNDSAKYSTKMEAPKTIGHWEDFGWETKLQSPHQKVFLTGSKNKYCNVANNVPKAVTPSDIGSLYDLGVGSVGSGGMNTNVDLSHAFQVHYYEDLDSSISPQFLAGISDSSGSPFITYPDPTDSWFPDFMELEKDFPAAGNASSTSGPSSCKRAYGNPEVSLKKFDLFKRFDTVEDHSDHLFSSDASSTNQHSKGWAKKIQDEWRILEKDLPDTIFVRVYESKMDLLRAVIIGAEGTPYHDGLFFFDMFFPPNYPNVPPKVKYHSGGLRINPNLYNCGKVCLSLLNTWTGSKKEMWTPSVSTVLQVLVSIQGLILNVKPYFNEPGFASTFGTPGGEIASLQYNERTLLYSLKTMVYSIRNPPKYFEDFVAGHFLKRAHDILVSCKAYLNGAQVGCLVKGGIQDIEAGDKSSSEAFRKNLAMFMKTLVDAFAQVGAKDCEKFLP